MPAWPGFHRIGIDGGLESHAMAARSYRQKKAWLETDELIVLGALPQ